MSDKPKAGSGEPAAPPKDAHGKAAKPGTEKAAKKGGFPIVLVLVPIALIAALALVYLLPPTHAMLVKSPLGPLIARLSHTAPVKPGAATAEQADPAAEVKRLTDTVASDKKITAEKDAQIAQLQAGVAKDSPPPVDAAPAVAAKPVVTAVPDDVKRAAAVWAAMDADKAADIIKQLPDAYVEAVFGQMPADAVSDIMSELPPKTAARLTTDAAPAPAPGAASPPATAGGADAPPPTSQGAGALPKPKDGAPQAKPKGATAQAKPKDATAQAKPKDAAKP